MFDPLVAKHICENALAYSVPYVVQVRNFLHQKFPGRCGALKWPARLPDLTPLDFSFEEQK